jgi:nuclear pore complex protein Nup98-Nup96
MSDFCSFCAVVLCSAAPAFGATTSPVWSWRFWSSSNAIMPWSDMYAYVCFSCLAAPAFGAAAAPLRLEPAVSEQPQRQQQAFWFDLLCSVLLTLHFAAPAFGAAASPSAFGAGGFKAAATSSCPGLTVVLFAAFLRPAAPAFGAAAAPSPFGAGGFGAAATPAASTPAFGGFGTATSQPAAAGGLFGAATSQPASSGGFSFGGSSTPAFGAAASTPAFGGELFFCCTASCLHMNALLRMAAVHSGCFVVLGFVVWCSYQPACEQRRLQLWWCQHARVWRSREHPCFWR